MKALYTAKGMTIAASCLLVLAGVVFLAFPIATMRVVCMALGVLLLVFAAGKLIGYFSNDQYGLAFQYDMALGVFIGIIGVVLLLHPDMSIGAIGRLLGLFVLIDGASRLQTALDARRFGMHYWWITLIGAVLTAGTAAVLIFYPHDSTLVLTQIAGVMLLIDGGQNLFVILYLAHTTGKRRRENGPFLLEEES